MKCNMCGREVDEKESFCLYCGSKLKKINNNKITKKEEAKKVLDDERDNTFKIAGIAALCLLPGIIISIIMYYRFASKTNKPSLEFFGPVPDVLIAYTFLFFAIILILIPVLIIIIGALTGVFRENKKKPYHIQNKSR